MNLLILGASGLVGKKTLQSALSDARIKKIIAPTRDPLAEHPKLINPVASELHTLLPQALAWPIDAVICALGTTMKRAGSKKAFRHVDYDLPLAFAKLAHQQGASIFALISSRGASADSSLFYMKTKGEIEKEIKSIPFKSILIAQPGLIGDHRSEPRAIETILVKLTAALAPVLPRSARVSRASKIAEILIEAVAAPTPGIRIIPPEAFI